MTVIIYTIPTCTWSDKAKAWLKKNKIEFEDRDVEESQNGKFRDEMLQKSSQLATPLIDIDGKILVGFNEEELKAALQSIESPN